MNSKYINLSQIDQSTKKLRRIPVKEKYYKNETILKEQFKYRMQTNLPKIDQYEDNRNRLNHSVMYVSKNPQNSQSFKSQTKSKLNDNYSGLRYPNQARMQSVENQIIANDINGYINDQHFRNLYYKRPYVNRLKILIRTAPMNEIDEFEHFRQKRLEHTHQ